jgi:PKD repeat protein
MYRNYDGNKSTFGDTSVSASVPNADNLSAFAAVRSTDGAMTVMVISKVLSGSTPVTLSLGNFSGNGIAQVYQLTAANAITRQGDIAYSGITLSTSVPQQSVTLFVLASGTPNVPPTAVISATPTSGTAPLTVTFSGSGSSDSDGSINSYSWVFGDGASASGVNVTHTYSTAGSYAAKLTVTDNRGATASSTATITVSPDPSVIAAPSNLTASSPARGSVNLTWRDNSANETGFQIERAAGTTSFVLVGTVPANTTTWSETVNRGTYNYRVRAVNATTGVNSAYSNTAQIRVK